MRIVPTPLSGLFQIEPDVFGDAQGKFVEIFRESRYDAASIENHSCRDNFPGRAWRCENSTISWAVLRES